MKVIKQVLIIVLLAHKEYKSIFNVSKDVADSFISEHLIKLFQTYYI